MTERRRGIGIVLIASVVQLAVAASVPLDPDETYYWEWSRHLATGYLDHPPMIALLIKAGVTLFGVNAFGVRVFSMLANLAAALCAVTIARRHGGERAAVRAACLVAAMPMLTTWLLLATPDPAYYFTSMAVLFCVDTALAQPIRSGASQRWWMAAGLCLGLAFASKYIAILIPLAMVLAFVSHKELRTRFAEPGPYLACGIATLVFVPVLLWNAQHDWISFRFQLQHGLGSAGRGTAVERVSEYLGQEAALATPILFVLMAVVTLGVFRKRLDARRHLLATIAAFTFGWFFISALRQPVEGNWPLMAYPAAAILLATTPFRAGMERVFRAGVVLGLIMVALVYADTVVRILPFPPDNDPVRRGHGWQEVARAVETTASPDTAHVTWLAGNRYQDASELAYHLPAHPTVFALNLESRANAYDLWPTFNSRASYCDNLVLVLDDVREDPTAHALSRQFATTEPGDRVSSPGLPPKRIWRFTCWQHGADT